MSLATKLPVMDVSTRKQPESVIAPVPSKIIPLKIGLMGEQGAGKTTTAALLAIALSKQYHGGAPVHTSDPELGWQFLEPIIFEAEGVQLVQRTVPTFKAMLSDLRLAQKEGACVWAVELGKMWTEILRTLQREKPVTWGSELSYMWTDFVNEFLNAKLHCMGLARTQDIVEQVINEQGTLSSVKVGEGMKAGGQRNNFGFEPHLVIRMWLEQKPRTKKGKVIEDGGRYWHHARVMKDRTWALNGREFSWSDKAGYTIGGFSNVWNDIKPHFLAVQKTKQFVTLDTTDSSSAILERDPDNSEYYEKRRRKEQISNETTETLDHLFGGNAADDKRIRREVIRHIFGIISKENVPNLTLEKLERGLHILQNFERTAKEHEEILACEASILAALDKEIADHDSGKVEGVELPF